jgi:hypothetical protein
MRVGENSGGMICHNSAFDVLPSQIAVEIDLQQCRGMIGRPPGRFRHDPGKAHGAEIEFVNEDFDDPDRIVLRYAIVQALGKQCRLPRSSPSTNRFIPTPSLIGNHSTKSTRFHTGWNYLGTGVCIAKAMEMLFHSGEAVLYSCEHSPAGSL